jgi:uncharacterized protein (TIGR03435 family)
MRITRGISVAMFASAAAWGQTAPANLEFEVASIRPSPPIVAGQPNVNIGLHIDGAQVRCAQLSLSDYLGMAYKLKNYQISGPDWLKSDRFDINAKMPEGAAREQVPEMLQKLLESRFQLKMHRDSKPFPVYALIVAKGGLKIKALPDDATDDKPNANVDVKVSGGPGGVSLNLGKGSYFNFGNNKLEVKKMTMLSLADMLARFMDRPVVDMTDLKGAYDFALDLAPEDYRSMMIRSAIAAGVQLPPEALRLLDGAADSSLHTGLQDLGLKLEPRKAPIEVLVMDHAEKTPTEN